MLLGCPRCIHLLLLKLLNVLLRAVTYLATNEDVGHLTIK